MVDGNFIYPNVDRFKAIFSGLDVAFGTGEGRWVKRPPRSEDFVQHLMGQGPGIGIAPLRSDSKVLFAAIDLDEPDFDAAREMQKCIPGHSFLEKSRSGNAHVWCFFEEPIEAWVAMGILKEATIAAGKDHVEVFPKNHNFERVRLGNYINLPFHGDSRPVMSMYDFQAKQHVDVLNLADFLDYVEDSPNYPEAWSKKADWLMISAPDQRESRTEFGTQANLHICGAHILETSDVNPVLEGHRASVYFALAKQLTNWSEVDHDEALMMMRTVNSDSPDPISDSELRRILDNAERGRFTSTGCDDPLFAPYAHPDCPIAHPKA